MSVALAQTVELGDGWQCKSSAEDKWYETKVPATVMGVLVSNGEYPDLLVGDNYKRLDNSRFLVPWLFKKEFRLESLGADEHVRLIFEGLGYSANIYLNDQLVASRDTVKGPFRTFAVDVTGVAREENVLVVETFKCEPGDYKIGFVDWNPRPLDESMGIVRPVKVQRSGAVVIESPRVCTQVNLHTLKEAWVKVEAQLRNLSSHEVEGRLVCMFEGERVAIPVTLPAGQARTLRLDDQDLRALYVVNPRLWWCYTMGSPELYALSLSFESGGEVSDARDVRFGIREVGSFITNDGYRAFTLNGRRIQLLGAGWTDDIFLRDDSVSYDRQLELVKQMNLNMVRLEGFWGTSQALYDLCDEKGILLLAGWSCFWEWDSYLGKPCDNRYGGVLTDEDAALIAQEYDDQLRYLRNHPSIIAWFVGSDKLPIPQLEAHYHWAQKTIDDRPYITSAKQMESDLSGTSGTKMAGPYEYVAPVYWYSKEAPGGAFGFNTETGIGAQLPVKESLRQMLGDRLWPLDEVWDYHCTFAAEAFNKLDILKETVTQRYGEAANIDDFLRKANMVNYDGTRAMFEAFRYNNPRATGLVQWMLNSARPSLYWQLYDHYLRPNAAFYSVRKACQPVQLIYNYLTHDVKAVNGTLVPVKIKATMAVYGVSGQLLDRQETVVEIPAMGSVAAFPPVSLTEDNGYLFLSGIDDGQVIAENEYALAVSEDIFEWEKSDWTGTPMKKHADLTAIGSQSPVRCKVAVKMVGNMEAELNISNPSERVAYLLRVVLRDRKGQVIDGVTFSDNYITIAPGGTKTIRCRLPRETRFTTDILAY
jgi:exo-1,4-beta-D-glucosaminidase